MIPKITDLQDIAGALLKLYPGNQLENLTLEFNVDKTTLKKINEELFYRNGGGGKLEECDDICVNIGNIKFHFVMKEQD